MDADEYHNREFIDLCMREPTEGKRTEKDVYCVWGCGREVTLLSDLLSQYLDGSSWKEQ